MDNHKVIRYKGQFEEEEHSYTFRLMLKGADFLDMRRSQDSRTSSDVTAYLASNLDKRLAMWTRDAEITPETLRDLPLDIYNVLYSVALGVEGDELKGSNAFLVEYWKTSSQPELPSPLNGSSSSEVPGSEDSSAEEEPSTTPPSEV